MTSAHTNENHTTHNIQYLCHNGGERGAETRFRNLSALHDVHTIHHLTQRGIEEGWSCLEIGGGAGSIISWLCERVGVTGRVLATNIEPQFRQALSFPNLEVCRHGIRSEPLPAGEFDLVHARLVLCLPERESTLRRMVAALKFGGWIVIEELDDLWLQPGPTVNPGEIGLRARHVLQHDVTSSGLHLRHGRHPAQQLRSNGLANIGADTSVFVWKARSAGTRLLKLDCKELREALTGWCLMSPSEFEADTNRVDDQDFFTLSQKVWTAWGQLSYAESDARHPLTRR
jgi:hypothetical protein